MMSVKSPRPLEYVPLSPAPPLSSTLTVPPSFAPSPPCTSPSEVYILPSAPLLPVHLPSPAHSRPPPPPQVYARHSALLPCLSPLLPPQVYAPSRTVVVYAPADFADKDADKKPHGIPGLGIKELGPYFSR